MKRFIFLLLLFVLGLNITAHNFFHEDFNPHKKYVILTNPTVHNIQTINFLLDADLLDIQKGKTKIVGVYYSGQAYDFSETNLSY